jgi:hypothetical protein
LGIPIAAGMLYLQTIHKIRDEIEKRVGRITGHGQEYVKKDRSGNSETRYPSKILDLGPRINKKDIKITELARSYSSSRAS